MRMLKKVAVVLALMVLSMVAAACNLYGQTSDSYFTVVQTFDNGNVIVMYANDTKVMYVWRSYYGRAGLTPVYNSDGSIAVWEK